VDSPPSGHQLRETDLLVPFEIQHLPQDYKEYYAIKRGNLFASILAFPRLWKFYTMLDDIWLRGFSDLKPPGSLAQFFPLMLYMNAHAKVRVSIELALSGCLSEARSILRDAIEFVAHAHALTADPKLQRIWLEKNLEQKAFADAFERNKKKGVFKGLDELHRSWGRLSETGAHANLNAICERFQTTISDDGSIQTWQLNYCGAEPRYWAMSLFTMLLTCSTMERTFFEDYAGRLNLDHVLVEMRSEFQRHKESTREYMNAGSRD
jgi:hypothetical protein